MGEIFNKVATICRKLGKELDKCTVFVLKQDYEKYWHEITAEELGKWEDKESIFENDIIVVPYKTYEVKAETILKLHSIER